MSTMEKVISNFEEFDPDILSRYVEEKLSLCSETQDKSSVVNSKNDSLKSSKNVNYNKYHEDKHLLTDDKLRSENEKESEKKIDPPEEEKTFFSCEEKETDISVKKEANIEVSNIINSELSSDSSSDSDSDDSDTLLTRGKEKTKKKTNRKQYERPTRRINKSELNHHSLKFLSAGFIVQNNVDCLQSSQAQLVNSNSFIPLHSIQSVDSTCFTDCSINSPFNVSSPESGYDTQWSDVFSPSPPNIPQISSRDLTEEEKEQQCITDMILELEETIKNIELQNLEVNIPPIDDFKHEDAIEQLKLFLKESGNESNSTINNELSFNLEDVESSRNEITDFIPLETLLDGYEVESNFQTISSDISVSELECIQSALDANITAIPSSYSSVRTTKRKLDYKLNDIAKRQLRISENFDGQKYLIEMKNLLHEIREKKQCIDIEQQTEDSKRTNLHNAVLNSNIERIYCLVELQKKCFYSIQFEINCKDSFKKTALDYAEDLKLPLIVDYLKENLAVKGV